MTFFKFFMWLSALCSLATIVFIMWPGQEHWAVITGFVWIVSFFAGMDELS